MYRANMIVKGAIEEEFLRRILSPELLIDIEIDYYRPLSGFISQARTKLSRERKPLVIVMNADSIEPEVIEERSQEITGVIRFAAHSVPFLLVSAIPSLEAWFFTAPDVIARALGQPVPEDFIPLGKRDPRGILQYLSDKCNGKWDFKRAIHLLDDSDIEKIRTISEVIELSNFLKKVQMIKAA